MCTCTSICLFLRLHFFSTLLYFVCVSCTQISSPFESGPGHSLNWTSFPAVRLHCSVPCVHWNQKASLGQRDWEQDDYENLDEVLKQRQTLYPRELTPFKLQSIVILVNACKALWTFETYRRFCMT